MCFEYPGTKYHVMSRGDRGEVFLDDVDRHEFKETPTEAWQKTGSQVHSFCLMPNHYHLVLRSSKSANRGSHRYTLRAAQAGAEAGTGQGLLKIGGSEPEQMAYALRDPFRK